jgi:Mg2+ and Co2+ transporter CorA
VIVLLTPSSSWALGGSNEYTYQGVDHTVHFRDDNDSFLYTPAPSLSELAEPLAVDETDQYCTDIERLLQSAQSISTPTRLDAICLEYLASKFLACTNTHLQADNRRLTAFRLTYDPVVRRKTGALGAAASAYAAAEPDAEAAHDPLRDLQYLRDRVARRQQWAEKLMQRVGLVLSNSSAPIAPLQAASLQFLHDAFPPLLTALNHLQGSISHAQSDISSSLQRRLTLLQLEEARKSIAQGAMVRKLTILAFVFVPVSATASAFGMNIAPLLSDPPPVWAFIVAALGLTGLLVGMASADGLASIVRGLRDAREQQGRATGRGTKTGDATKRRQSAAWAKLANLSLTALWALIDTLRLLLLPLTLGIRILKHMHAQGSASREREARDVDALVRARFAFREGPWKIWVGAWTRGWGRG